ncbi:hypothetical protein Tco_0667009 [Tanacetum coccineum]
MHKVSKMYYFSKQTKKLKHRDNGEKAAEGTMVYTCDAEGNKSSSRKSYRPPTHSADLDSPATCLEENENGFVKVKSKREELINALECNESFLYIVCKGWRDEKENIACKALDNSTSKANAFVR